MEILHTPPQKNNNVEPENVQLEKERHVQTTNFGGFHVSLDPK